MSTDEDDGVDDRREAVTRILRGGLGDGERREQLLELVYDELRSIAGKRMGGERAAHTLQATALVHEAYLRLVGDTRMDWRDRRHFYGAAGEAMRRVLIDHARRVRSAKRGGGVQRVTLGAAELEAELEAEEALALAEALERLEGEDAQAAAVARLRFLSGLSVADTARALSISERTVHREWTFARARLSELLEGSGA